MALGQLLKNLAADKTSGASPVSSCQPVNRRSHQTVKILTHRNTELMAKMSRERVQSCVKGLITSGSEETKDRREGLGEDVAVG